MNAISDLIAPLGSHDDMTFMLLSYHLRLVLSGWTIAASFTYSLNT